MILKNYLIGILLCLPSAGVFIAGMLLSNVWFERASIWWFFLVVLISIGVFFGGYFLTKKLVNKSSKK